MRLFLDENLPKRLKLDFPEHEVLLSLRKIFSFLRTLTFQNK